MLTVRLMTSDRYPTLDLAPQAFGEHLRVVVFEGFDRNDHELVTTEPADDTGVRVGVAQSLRDDLDELVAGDVSEVVVEGLGSVQVEEKRRLLVVPTCPPMPTSARYRPIRTLMKATSAASSPLAMTARPALSSMARKTKSIAVSSFDVILVDDAFKGGA